ncbi:hypothetical protein K227x_15530 [Rubripirellula lacrimiformis]|uniref:Uncharacterized protein n=1 Tax=Rubripirellula lacrimiformis TaxID=1930273 RepID=A0A517N7R5_9BACT|nr:hypothetical protein [Rubripirellula lacrimiformis]QDT03171.1 hypothetical protein K227x_15530 [Rubripirellula lacrimiformis]
MNKPAEIFASLAQHRSEPAVMLDQMIEHFRQERSAMELFEAMKMRVRHQVGLPLVPFGEEPARSEEVERQLELGLLQACREAGTILVQDGRVAEGWMYLRPTADMELARELISKIEITDDNYDDMIQVLLHEGVDVARGFQAVIDHQGTCNSVTLYEQSIVARSMPDRKAASTCLLNHLYGELCSLVRSDIAQKDGEPPAGEDESLGDMIESRRWILEGGGYHLDTTHLAATVRVATVLDDPALLKKAWELTQYGRRLHHQFQYPGDEPFVDFYPAYGAFYSVLLGQNVDAGLKLFQRKASTVDVAEHGTGAIETYVDLLDRIGRHGEAVTAAIELVPADVPAQRIVPMLIEIAGRAKDAGDPTAFESLLAYCQQREDVLGYAAALHAA